jgi:L-lactate dehydrogenase complex protein LldG
MSRESMLATIRAAVKDATATPNPRRYAVHGDHAPGSDFVLELLVDRLIDYRAAVRRVAETELATAVSQALSSSTSVVVPPGLPPAVLAAVHTDGRTVHTDGVPEPLSADQLDRIDAVVTGAKVAIAVTGTIILDAGADQGRRAITLIPDRHLVILRADQIVETVPEGIALLNPTAPLTMISGPSATSDIELERVEGVHGPRNLEVIIVETP